MLFESLEPEPVEPEPVELEPVVPEPVEPELGEVEEPDEPEPSEPDDDVSVPLPVEPDPVEPVVLPPMLPDDPLPLVPDVSLLPEPEVPELPDIPLPELEPDVPLWPVVVDGELLLLPLLCESPDPLVDWANAPAAAIEPAARIVAANLPSFIVASLVDGDGDHRRARCLRFSTVRNETASPAR